MHYPRELQPVLDNGNREETNVPRRKSKYPRGSALLRSACNKRASDGKTTWVLCAYFAGCDQAMQCR